jgi:hypothetical protein
MVLGLHQVKVYSFDPYIPLCHQSTQLEYELLVLTAGWGVV